MKYLKIKIDPIRMKGDADDFDQLQSDLYERIIAMVEAETLSFSIDDEDDEDDDFE